jgi:hypothetical protein
MNEKALKVMETMTLEEGLRIDVEEGWRKIIQRQFGGDPGRAFSELIQNFIDSYPSSVPWSDRKAEIDSWSTGIALTDYGEGMPLVRVRLLLTLGGTDKADHPEKLGYFGNGFFSIFDPRLGIKVVRVVTKCEGQMVEILFTVREPEKRPAISSRILGETAPFSTRVEVQFENRWAVENCLFHARHSLNYYPCRVTIDGEPFRSIWENARQEGAQMFEEAGCSGFIQGVTLHRNTRILCKYERLMEIPLGSLLAGAGTPKGDLRDYAWKDMPCLFDKAITINSNCLNLVISRDSFYVDYAYNEMLDGLRRVLMEQLHKELENGANVELILANQYIFWKRIKEQLQQPRGAESSQTVREDEKIMDRLASEKLYRLKDQKGFVSLKEIWDMREEGVPVFYSPMRLNLNWAGGRFKHRFIVLPPLSEVRMGTSDFYDEIFSGIFGDVVNLDHIHLDQVKIRDLIKRGIVDESAVSPKCRIIGERRISSQERGFLKEIGYILNQEDVRRVIQTHLHLPASRIEPVLFEMEEKGATIATGLFEGTGKALGSSPVSNFDGKEQGADRQRDDGILLGLEKSHPHLRRLMHSEDPHRAYFAVLFLAHEVVNCQKLLAPYSPFYHVVKEKLAADMRRVLMGTLLNKDLAPSGPV